MGIGYGGRIKRVLTTVGEPDPTKPTYLSRLFHWRRYRALVAVLRTLSGGHVRSILDVGCGKGFLYRLLTASGVRVDSYVCLDIDLGKLNEAEGMRVRADAHRVPVARCSMEYSVASEVLEHLERPFIALREALLATRGYAVITFPEETVKNALGFRYPEHVTNLNVDEVSSLAERYGFGRVLRYRLNFAYPPSIYDRLISYREDLSRILEALQRALGVVGELCMIKTEVLVFKRNEGCETPLSYAKTATRHRDSGP